MNRSESITKLAAALLAAQKTMGTAVKGANNPFYKSTYADLNSIREAAIPALNAQGVSVLQPTSVGPVGNYVETLLIHESGEWISGVTAIKNAKGDAQGEGSGISYARRYGLQSMLNIGAVDDDGEAAQGRENVKETKGLVDNTSSSKAIGGERRVQANTIQHTQKTDTKTAQSNGNTKERITQAFKVLEAQKKITKEQFKTKYQKDKGLSTLTDVELTGVLSAIKADFPQLGL